MRDHDIGEVLYKGLTILNTLLAWAGKKVSRRDLAEKTGLAPKQVGRYLNTLEALHFPLRRERRGPEEMVMMTRDARRPLRLLPFTTEELTAVSFYTALSPYVQDRASPGSLHTAGAKIAAFLQEDVPQGGTRGAAFLSFAKHYKTYNTPKVQAVLTCLVPALVQLQVCRITYKTPTADHARSYTIHPYTLCVYHGGMYLLAYRPEADTLMVLSVERLETLTVEDGSFTKVPEVLQRIDARRQRVFGIIDDDDELAVTLKFTAEQAPYIRERVWHPTQQLETQPDGSLRLQFQASGWFEIVRWVLGWGNLVEVLEPPALRQAIVQHLQAAARQYASDDVEAPGA